MGDYKFQLKRSRHNKVPSSIEKYLDDLIMKPFVRIPTFDSRKLGQYTKELKSKGLLKIYWNKDEDHSIAILKFNNFLHPNSVKKNNGLFPEYVFKNLF